MIMIRTNGLNIWV